MSKSREKRRKGRRGADPSFERAKEQGGAALGRVRGRVSRRTTIRGVGGRVQVRRRRRRGAPSRANAPRNAKSKCRCEASCQPSLELDAPGFGSHFLRRFPFSRERVARGAPSLRRLSRDGRLPTSLGSRSPGGIEAVAAFRIIDPEERFADRSIFARQHWAGVRVRPVPRKCGLPCRRSLYRSRPIRRHVFSATWFDSWQSGDSANGFARSIFRDVSTRRGASPEDPGCCATARTI